jgi:hypothetical protein
LADLAATLAIWMEYAQECGALPDSAAFLARAEAAVMDLNATLAMEVAEQDVVVRFLALLQAVLSAGAGHVVARERADPTPTADATLLGWTTATDGTLVPRGRNLGWTDGERLFLLPAPTVATVQTLAGQLGDRLPAGERTIGQRLRDRGVLLAGDADHTTKRIPIGGRWVRTWVLPLSAVFGTAAEDAAG